jgi:glucokinase
MLVTDGCVAGVEISGRGRRVALADMQGAIMAEHGVTTPPPPPAEVIGEIGDLFQACLTAAHIRRDRVVRIGCGFGGPVDADSGVVLLSHRLAGWENIPLANLLEERLGAQTLLDNDARAAALGEARFGAGRGERHLAYVHLGTGLGGGLVIDGRLYYGATATAGELGHLLVNEDGPLCSCGKPGHLEAYASGTAIVQRALALAAQLSPPGPLLTSLNQGQQITPASVFAAARDGDEAARTITEEAVRYLGIALANLVTTCNPGVVVVGGRVAEAGPLLFEPLRGLVRRYAMAVPARAARITPGALKEKGIIVGAIALALQSLAWT